MPSATAEISTLSLHDALPISTDELVIPNHFVQRERNILLRFKRDDLVQFFLSERRQFHKPDKIISFEARSEEHTSELQSLRHLVCRLLLEKKKHAYRTHSNNV